MKSEFVTYPYLLCHVDFICECCNEHNKYNFPYSITYGEKFNNNDFILICELMKKFNNTNTDQQLEIIESN
jgi:hypothetical protein